MVEISRFLQHKKQYFELSKIRHFYQNIIRMYFLFHDNEQSSIIMLCTQDFSEEFHLISMKRIKIMIKNRAWIFCSILNPFLLFLNLFYMYRHMLSCIQCDLENPIFRKPATLKIPPQSDLFQSFYLYFQLIREENQFFTN